MSVPALLKKTFQAWRQDKASYLAAAIAYYTVFSLAPLLIVLLAIAGIVFDNARTHQELFTTISQSVGPEAASYIESMLAAAVRATDNRLAFIIGGLLTLAGSVGLFGQIRTAMNIIWHVPPKQRTWLPWLQYNLLLFLIVILSGMLFIVSLITSTILSWSSTYIAYFLGGSALLLSFIHSIASFGLITLLFALLFKALPDTYVSVKYAFLSAVFTAVLFTIGKFFIGLYLSQSGITSAYGAAGSFAVILVWIYYAAQLFLYGAELVKVQQQCALEKTSSQKRKKS